MEIEKIFENPFKTVKEKGLKSERDIVPIKINWDSPKGDTFFGRRCPDAFKTHPLAIKAHTYGSSLR